MAGALHSIDDLQRRSEKGSPAWQALEDLRLQLLGLKTSNTIIAVDVDTRAAQVKLDQLRRAIRDTAAGTIAVTSASTRAAIRRNGNAWT
jgi:hypothetical protein